jgi:hypothetical protein
MAAWQWWVNGWVGGGRGWVDGWVVVLGGWVCDGGQKGIFRWPTKAHRFTQRFDRTQEKLTSEKNEVSQTDLMGSRPPIPTPRSNVSKMYKSNYPALFSKKILIERRMPVIRRGACSGPG